MPWVANPARAVGVAQCSAPISAGAFEHAGDNVVRKPTGG
jgi:hypothetical protein